MLASSCMFELFFMIILNRFTTNLEGIQGTIKESNEDFVVKELYDNGKPVELIKEISESMYRFQSQIFFLFLEQNDIYLLSRRFGT